MGPFPITKKIKKLTYELKLPPVMTIYPVVSVAQLEPVFNDSIPYGRTDNKKIPSVITENDEILK